MFHFGGYRLLWVCPEDTEGFPSVGFPIRASRDHRLLAPPPGLSQLATPFIASGRPGIHPGPFPTIKTYLTFSNFKLKKFFQKVSGDDGI